ncbi:hypothetical protein NDN08_007721 [Rhodosorus marinus]|uniref:PH domain-containing protein n=1 Tax=Rhodosorus marinus TaxID=101924 RepID=A0AAV8UYC7_9RHOD|nr:hypothetical protein NDN08_007721 [Rhodosorus marinus]
MADPVDKENAPFVEQFASPTQSFLKAVDSRDYDYFADLNDGDDDLIIADVPEKGNAALKDLYRFSYRLGQQLRKEINEETTAQEPEEITVHQTAPEVVRNEDIALCVQGELYLKSRWLHRWKKRFGSVANHAQYGPVLFLFAYDKEGNVDLKNSKMIALLESSVKLGRNVKSADGKFKCEFILSTQKRRHILAAADAVARDFWIENMKKLG